MLRPFLLAGTAALTLAACAPDPASVAAAYVSPAVYSQFNCAQLNAEAARLSARLSELTGQQAQAANSDAALTAVTLVLFWPAVFFIGGGDVSGELARLKGEAEALQQAAIARSCG